MTKKTSKPKAPPGKRRGKKLKLGKETLKDLDPKGRGGKVKGGWGPVMPTYGCATKGCPVNNTAGTVCGTNCGILIG